MKGAAKTSLQYLAYLGYRSIVATAAFLPLGACLWVGKWSGRIIWAFALPYRRLVARNLRIALSDEHDSRRLATVNRRQFEAIGRNFLVSLKLSAQPPGKAEELVTYVGREHIEAAAARGKGLIAAISHLGPWELYSQLPSLGPGVAPATMYRALENPFINRHVVEQRGRIGVALFDKTTGVYGPLKHLREGGGIGILIDQHAGDLGIWSPFFGRLASTTNLPALLSLRTGAPIVTTSLLPDGPGRWRVVYQPPHFPPDEKPADFAAEAARLTHALNRELEYAIREAPEEWFWLHDRWKTPKPAFLLGQNKRGYHLPEGDDHQLKPFRLLLRSPNPLGDACMAVPAIRAIRATRPDLHLTILCRDSLAPVWRRVPGIDEIVTLQRREKPRHVARRLRQTGCYDAALLFPGSLRAALEAWLAGIPRIAGFRGHHRHWLLDQVVPPPPPGPPRHHAHSYLHLAAHAGADIAEESQAIETPPLPTKAGARPDGQPLLVGICPGAEYGAAKRWPEDRFATVARRLRDATGCGLILFGSPAERPIGEKLAALIGDGCDNRVGSTTLDELIEAVSGCDLIITNDTGTMHLAALLGVPTVAVFGSTEPAWTRPLGSGHRVYRRHVECSPCFLRECPRDFRCMLGVDPEVVAQGAIALLTHQPA
ncbi:MAG: lipopolysaccharide heptosyltransferase II [Verrucomicrobiales bacterium]|nr:lipopolysaccharide heptosyltransferase II [Verrucomicrobiales bacterium]